MKTSVANYLTNTIRWLMGSKRLGYNQVVSSYRETIRAMLSRDEILQYTAQTVQKQLKANRVLVWVYQAETGNMLLSHAVGQITETSLAELFPLDIRPETLDQTYYTTDLPEGTSRQGLMMLKLQVIIPIQLRHTLMGMVGIGYDAYRGPYSPETTYWLNLLATEAALSLRNVQLEESLEKLRPVYKWTIDARESERRRLASELHDDVMAQMTTLTMTINMARSQLAQLNGNIDPKVLNWLETVSEGMPQLNRRLREIMNGLYPSVLTNLGLIAALRTHIDSLARQPLPPNNPAETIITMTWEGFGERIEDPNLERDLYYVTRQAIDNAVKHAQANQILVNIRWGTLRTQPMISITIRDTGRGMKATPDELVGRNGRLGLVSMNERVIAWNGTLVMESEPNQGTTILARVPVEQAPDSSEGLQQAVRRLKRENVKT
ncbi:ATP-binding protein [Anaerolineales bacterium HSG24]|nr:ATP-binding protein [Anaerolineales bacterium HSG24]